MTPENIAKLNTGLDLISRLDYNGFVDVSEAVKDSLLIYHHENSTTFRFILPTIILNVFEAKFDLEDFISNLFPQYEFTGASTCIRGEMLSVVLWLEAQEVKVVENSDRKLDEWPF